MKYEDIGREMLKDIENNEDLVNEYNLEQYSSLNFNCENNLIHILFAICLTKDEKQHRDEEKTTTNRVSRQINHILHIKS